MFAAGALPKTLKNLINLDSLPKFYGITDSFIEYLICKEKLTEFIRQHGEKEVNTENLALLKQFLFDHWMAEKSIRKTDFAYPHCPDHVIAQFYLALSERLSAAYAALPANNEEEKQGRTDRYFLLMPTLTQEIESDGLTPLELQFFIEYTAYQAKTLKSGHIPKSYADYFHDLRKPLPPAHKERIELKEFILSDEDDYLPVIDTLQTAEYDGILKNINTGNTLSETEKARLLGHSKEANAYYAAIQIHQQWLDAVSPVGIAYKELLAGLTEGDAIVGNGQHNNAGKSANEAIYQFSEFLNSLETVDSALKNDLFQLLGFSVRFKKWFSFGEMWSRLSNPTDRKNILEIYCIFYIREILSGIYDRNLYFFNDNNQFIDAAIKAKSLALENLQKAVANPDFKVQSSYKEAGKQRLQEYIHSEHHSRLLANSELDDLQMLFKESDLKELLVRIWQCLSPNKKEAVVEVLDGERLLDMLRAQSPEDQASDFMTARNRLAELVSLNDYLLNKIDAARSTLSAIHLPLLTELTYRSVLRSLDPNNESNNQRYPIVSQAIAKTACGKMVGGVALALFGGSVLTAATLCALASADVPSPLSTEVAIAAAKITMEGVITTTVGAGLGGIASLSVGSYLTHKWKKFSNVAFAANRFFNSEVKTDTNLSPPDSIPSVNISMLKKP